jgi:diaminopimelate decarboxylase
MQNLPKGRSKIFYAMKALSNLAILRLMSELGLGLDTVSLFEIQMGLKAGFEPEDIIFTPNVIHFSEIEEAVELGTGINIENLSNLRKFGERFGSNYPCCIRFNPNIALEDQSNASWYEESKFGIPYAKLDEILKIVEQFGIHVEGIHIHSSHVIMQHEILLKSAELMFEAAKRFENIQYLDFGGGLNPKPRKQEATDIKVVGESLAQMLASFKHPSGVDLHLRFEPGRFLVGEAGTLYVETTILKQNGDVQFAGVDSGFNHLIRPMFYDSHHTIENLSNPNAELEQYTVVGNLCEVDNFAKGRRIPKLREGDILAIKDAGAYGFSMSSQYNSRPRPAEVLLDGPDVTVIREREGLADMLRNQVVRKLTN